MNNLLIIIKYQPKNKFGGIGSIDYYKNTLYGKNVIDIFIEMFGENNIVKYQSLEKKWIHL